MSYLHDLTAAGIGRVANPLGLPIRSGILRAETGNWTGQWKGDKDEVRVLIAEALGIAPEQIRPSRYRWDIPGAAWSGICAAFCLSDCHNHLNRKNNCYRTPRYVKANAIGIWLKIAHSPEPLTWGLVAANDWNVYLTVSWTRCWAAWKLFWAEAFN